MALVVVAAALLTAACGGASDPSAAAEPGTGATKSAGPPKHGGTLVLGTDFEPGVLNRLVAVDGVNDRIVNSIVHEPLVEADASWRFTPQLATEVPTVENGGVRIEGKDMVVRVGLRRGVTWSDGAPFNCSDVRFTWQTILDKRWLVTSKIGWDRVREVRCPTPHNVEFVFDGPYASFMRVLQAAPLPRHVLEGKNFNKAWRAGIPVSNGPYRFERWDRGKRIVLVRNKRYWKRGTQNLPYLDRIVIEFYRSPNTLDIQLSSGRVHLINRGLEANAAEERRIFPRSQYLVTPGTGIEHLGFNLESKPFNELHVRKAIAYAIDREQLAERVLGKPFSVVDSTLLPAQGAYFAAHFGTYRHDPKAVARHLEQAGFKRVDGMWQRDGKVLSIRYKSVTGKPLRLRIAQMLQQQFRSQGIDMSIRLEQPQVFFGQSLASGEFDLAQWGFGVGVDPEQRFYFACEPSPGNGNAYRFCDDRIDELIEEGDRTIDVPARARLTHEFQRRMAEKVPLLPLYQHMDLVVLAPQVRGVVPNPQTGISWNIEQWWLDS